MTQTSAPLADASQRFSDLALSPELKKSIKELGYVTPTAFQLNIFESFNLGNNIVSQGQSSYGKSLAFSLPIVANIKNDQEEVQALIIVENALQADLVTKEYRALCRHLSVGVGNSLEALKSKDSISKIIILPVSEFKKIDLESFESLHTIFLDSLSNASTQAVTTLLTEVPMDNKQILIFSPDTDLSVQEYVNGLNKKVDFINNNDQPKITLPAKHIFHQAKEAEPKPRALLAALELHKPKFALVTCVELQEADLLGRFLSRYGYRVQVESEENGSDRLRDLISSLGRDSYDIVIVKNSSASRMSLDALEFMINYDMFDRPAAYEQTTQFNKQALGTQRTIVNILTSREVGSLSPIKSQCLIDFTEMPLPSDDEVMTLCARRISEALNEKAAHVELGQFELLAEKIFQDKSALKGLSLLLRNHLLQTQNVRPAPSASDERPRDQRRPHRLPQERAPRPHRERERPHSQPNEVDNSAEQDESNDQESHSKNGSLGITRLYITLGKGDGFDDLASLAQYLSEKSGVDLGHFSGSGMVRDHSAHVEVDDDVAADIIKALNESPRPHREGHEDGEAPNLVVCEKARMSTPRPYRRGMPPRRRPNFSRR